jgi:hypothetical protein
MPPAVPDALADLLLLKTGRGRIDRVATAAATEGAGCGSDAAAEIAQALHDGP